jgi:hypothetical protein
MAVRNIEVVEVLKRMQVPQFVEFHEISFHAATYGNMGERSVYPHLVPNPFAPSEHATVFIESLGLYKWYVPYAVPMREERWGQRK